MKPVKLIFTLGVMALLSSALTLLYYSFFVVEESYSLAMNIKVRNEQKLGLNADPTLSFGTVQSGGSSKKIATMQNLKDYPVKAIINLKAPWNDWISLSKNNFILEPYSSHNITFTVSVPESAHEGDYSGAARFLIKKV